jgi:hypothetical protein
MYYGAIVTAAMEYNLRTEERERLAQEDWQLRHLRSAESRIARAVVARAGAFLRSAVCLIQGRARPASQHVSC